MKTCVVGAGDAVAVAAAGDDGERLKRARLQVLAHVGNHNAVTLTDAVPACKPTLALHRKTVVMLRAVEQEGEAADLIYLGGLPDVEGRKAIKFTRRGNTNPRRMASRAGTK